MLQTFLSETGPSSTWPASCSSRNGQIGKATDLLRRGSRSPRLHRKGALEDCQFEEGSTTFKAEQLGFLIPDLSRHNGESHLCPGNVPKPNFVLQRTGRGRFRRQHEGLLEAERPVVTTRSKLIAACRRHPKMPAFARYLSNAVLDCRKEEASLYLKRRATTALR